MLCIMLVALNWMTGLSGQTGTQGSRRGDSLGEGDLEGRYVGRDGVCVCVCGEGADRKVWRASLVPRPT